MSDLRIRDLTRAIDEEEVCQQVLRAMGQKPEAQTNYYQIMQKSYWVKLRQFQMDRPRSLVHVQVGDFQDQLDGQSVDGAELLELQDLVRRFSLVHVAAVARRVHYVNLAKLEFVGLDQVDSNEPVVKAIWRTLT